MFELMALIALACLALGIYIGRLDTQNKHMVEEATELEQLSMRYRPVIKEAAETISRINAAGLQ